MLLGPVTPRALQISVRNPVQEDLVFSGDVTQLRNDELFQNGSCIAGHGRAGSPLHTTALGSTLLAAQSTSFFFDGKK